MSDVQVTAFSEDTTDEDQPNWANLVSVLAASGDLLFEWDLPSVLLRASQSTVLAGTPPSGDVGWSVRFGHSGSRQKAALARAAISGSGTGGKTAHIVDPRSIRPVRGRRLAWARAPTAAEADAISTALVIMNDDELRAFCRNNPQVHTYVHGAH